jgi:exopolysaccharide biosynthesis operon protein EpsL
LRRAIGVSGSAFLLAGLLAPASSWALWNDNLEVYAQENVTYDSNVFRLSEKLDPAISIGDSRKGDTIFTTAAGFNFDAPVSLQRFQVSAAFLDSRYSHFKDVDHHGHTLSAAWLWSITPRITGALGYQEEKTLANFANIQSRRPDLITSRTAFANGAWMLTPSWRLHGDLAANRTDHTEAADLQDLENGAAEVGLSYVTAQENRIGFDVRSERGRSPEERIVAGIPFDNEYTQAGIGVLTRWVLTGHSRFDGRADYIRRRYDQFPERNYSGPTFRATYTWTPTGKITVATIAQRDIAPLEDINTSFVLVTSLTVRPDWQISEKLNLRGNFAYAKWDYRGDPALGLDFEHRVKTAGVSLLWRPFTRVSLSGGIAREERTSTLATGDYKVNQATVEARIGF